MKTCRYCGRENPDEGSHCSSCGTELVPEPIDSRPSQPPDRTWIKTAFLWAGALLTLLLFYLLSLGPVIRWTGKVTSSTTTSTPTGFVSRRVVTIPRWVGIVYAPAFLLRQSAAGDVGNLYERYLEWWEKPEPKR